MIKVSSDASSREFAGLAAETIARLGGLRGARVLGLTQLLDGMDQEAAVDVPLSAFDRGASHIGVARVGIWEARDDGTFARAQDSKQDWGYWASVGTIGAKGPHARVVYLGESAARGFFYDPLFNPAQALSLMLVSAVPRGVEIIDLACIDQTLPELSALFESTFALAPDAFVIYAGNNWGNTRKCQRLPTTLAEREASAAALRESGVAGLQRVIEKRVAQDATAFVRLVAQRCMERGVPVVFLIPEYNLLDWRDARPIAPWLPDGRNVRWRAACKRAQDALAEGEFELATEAAEEMVALDGGTCALGLFILGECASRNGRRMEARQYLERSRDAVLWDPMPQSPRGYTVVQETLRREAAAHAIPVVDLPRVFERYLGGELPDRRMFIDYCHLSSDGIRVAMAHTAACLLPLLGHAPVSAEQLARTNLPISAQLEAQAHFAAAIHNAHWGHDCEEVVKYHCAAALTKDPAIRESMWHYMELTTRQAPVWMCSAAEALAQRSANPFVARYIIGTWPMQPKVPDRALCGILLRCLRGDAPLEELRIEEHARDGATLDLLSPYACVTAVSDREAAWLTGGGGEKWAGYFKAYAAESHFTFIERDASPGRLRLVARAPYVSQGARIFYVELNGQRLFEGELQQQWALFTVEVRAQHVRRGLNDLILRWPAPTFEPRTALEQAAQDLELGKTPELYPVFGEIHSLTYA